MTRLMLTSIPYFKEVIVSSFRCEHCGNQNNEIQSAGTYRGLDYPHSCVILEPTDTMLDFGLVYTVKVLNAGDLNRQLVKSSYATVTIPELELTIPPSRGQLTTIEGLLNNVIDDLSPEQPLRKIQDPAAYEKIQSILDKLRDILPELDEDDSKPRGARKRLTKEERADVNHPVPPFTLKVEDPSGNSFIEFVGSMSDPKWNMHEYNRSTEDNLLLGLISPDDAMASVKRAAAGEPVDYGKVEMDEILIFPGQCSSCSRPLDTKMKRVDIPYFKEIIIMSTNCESCGYRDNEVKSSGAVSEMGKRITLKVEDSDDLSRDILKVCSLSSNTIQANEVQSETCGFRIPEIDLTLTAGTLGGRFTTIEGVLDQIYDELSGKLFSGDSSTTEDHNSFHSFLSKLKEVKSGSRPFTLILDDPLSNSYLQNLYAPDPDPNMTTELYARTEEQNDDLGLLDMKVEGYENDVETSTQKAGLETLEEHASES